MADIEAMNILNFRIVMTQKASVYLEKTALSAARVQRFSSTCYDRKNQME